MVFFLRALLLLAGLALTVCIHAQIESFYIEIRTDEHPEEISWTISDESGEILISDDSTIIAPNKVYTWEYRVEKQDCYRFDIYDSQGDGIQSPGYYRVRRGNVWLQGQVRLFKENNFHYSGECIKGTTCDNPMPVTSTVMYAPSEVDYWYSVESDENSNFNINTCKTFADSSDSHLDTEFWIYDGCPNQISEGPEGALVYNQNFVSCSPGSGVANYPINKNRKYIIRIKSSEKAKDDRIAIAFEDSGEIEGCMDSLSCSYNPLATVDDGTCIYDEGCAPDLVICQGEFLNSIYLDTIVVSDPCLIEENCVSGTGKRDIIRFTTFISNDGSADYIVGNPDSNPIGFSIDNCHEHWHRLGYAEYLLYEDEGIPVPLGFKNGFCLLDIACTDTTSYAKYSCDYMGISAGCYDIYDASVECQWLDVTDVPDGNYTMVARVNWAKIPDLLGRHERSYDNNWAQACITLDRSSGKLELSVSENCGEYRDCTGKAFGSAVVDCNGVCGGLSHYGDINQDQVLDQTDFEEYIDLLSNGGQEATKCIDLNSDGMITVYDAVLLKDCISDYDESDPFHNHCPFPKNIMDNDNDVNISISHHDIDNKKVTLSYQSSTSLSAIQLRMDGIGNILNITLEEDQNIESICNYKNEIIVFEDNEMIESSAEEIQLLTFEYDSLTSSTICISDIVDVISDKYQKINRINELPSCEKTTSTEDYDLDRNIEIFPNPSKDMLFLKCQNDILELEIYDASGTLIRKIDSINSDHFQINTSEFSNGVFFIKVMLRYEFKMVRIIKI